MMAFKLKYLLSCMVAILALVNPIQKVFVITSLQAQFDEAKTRFIAIKATITAFIALLFFLLLGELVFSYVFHVQLYAFQITSGIVLFYNGLTGLQKGTFIQVDAGVNIRDITAVPIAIPMIAGPATITAAVTFPAHYGHTNTIVSLAVALAINYIFMYFARPIGTFLNRLNLMSALVRIFGLIVATIGVQMTLNGLATFWNTIK
ncbi:MarC family protein [Tenuifilum thalassicum]|nr:MarC family protein [Tenuifilum thalassicum]